MVTLLRAYGCALHAKIPCDVRLTIWQFSMCIRFAAASASGVTSSGGTQHGGRTLEGEPHLHCFCLHCTQRKREETGEGTAFALSMQHAKYVLSDMPGGLRLLVEVESCAKQCTAADRDDAPGR